MAIHPTTTTTTVLPPKPVPFVDSKGVGVSNKPLQLGGWVCKGGVIAITSQFPIHPASKQASSHAAIEDLGNQALPPSPLYQMSRPSPAQPDTTRETQKNTSTKGTKFNDYEKRTVGILWSNRDIRFGFRFFFGVVHFLLTQKRSRGDQGCNPKVPSFTFPVQIMSESSHRILCYSGINNG